MDSKTIYIIRHGETDFNKLGIVQGNGVDSSLNENGCRQSILFFKKFQDFSFDKIYTSTLKRTVQSVEKFINKGIPHESLEGLNEISWGKSEGIPFSPESNQVYLNIIERWKEGDIDRSLEGGESPVQVMERQKKSMQYILSKKEEKNILICMHGRAMKILLCWLTGRPISEMDSFDHDNLSLYVLHYNSHGFEIRTTNDRSHLISVL